eukprot:gene2662-3073_t
MNRMSSYYEVPSDFAIKRKEEIREFIKAALTSKVNARAFQSLPRHLRRRAMSSNPYRVPLYIRQRARREAKKTIRRTNRRPPYLLRDYERRQRQYKWLETHIWHAKRMKMVNLWGHRLALHPAGKGFRSTFRASSHLSTIYDTSYYRCVEFVGLQSDIVAAFKPMTPPDALTIAACMYIDGSREGRTNLYYPNRYPYHYLGPLQFSWRQEDATHNATTDTRQLWVWIHPATQAETLSILQSQSKANNVTLNLIDDQVVRFELTGTQTHSIIQSVLHTLGNSTDEASKLWNSLKQLRSAATLPTGTIIGLNVYDPRLYCHVPPEVAKAVGSVVNPAAPIPTATNILTQRQLNDTIVNLGKHRIAQSPLRCAKSRASMSPIEPVHLVNLRRKQPNEESKWPTPSIMLIQRDGGLTRGYGSGWDIVLPKGWGTSFWIPFVYSGAWAIGLRNRESFSMEQGLPSFPRDFPDCHAHIAHFQEHVAEQQTQYDKVPKKKRPNYKFNCIHSPFAPDWQWILRQPESKAIQFSETKEQQAQVEQEPKAKKTTIESTSSKDLIPTITYQPLPYFVYRGKLAMSLMSIKSPVAKSE